MHSYMVGARMQFGTEPSVNACNCNVICNTLYKLQRIFSMHLSAVNNRRVSILCLRNYECF